MKTDKTEVADKILADIKQLCKTVGDRSAGSDGERQTAEYFANELSDCTDSVKTETFKLNPSAYTGWIALSITAILLGYVAYFFSSFVALLLFVIALIPFIGEYMLLKRMFDPLYAEKTSQNLTAIKKCTETPLKRIYFVANTDACFENALKYRFGGVVFLAVFSLDIIALAYYIALSIARWVLVGGIGAGIANGAMLYAGLAGIVFVIPLFASYFTLSNKVVTDGANRNLTGCFIATRVLQALKDCKFKNTEIGVILTGGGTVGLRGAKAWCDAHSDEVDKQNTVFISLASLRELGSLNVNSSDMNGFLKSDKDVVKLVLDSAENVGVKCSNHRIPFDASDSVPFIQSGCKSAGICAISVNLPDYYNTRYDSYDNLSGECIAECYSLALEIIKNYAGETPVVNESEIAEHNKSADTAESQETATD